MKLKKRVSRKRKIIVIIAVALAVAALIAVGAIIIVNKIKSELGMDKDAIYVSIYPTKKVYYIGEEFDGSGILVQVQLSDGSTTFIEDPSQLTFEGFDSSVPCEEQEIKVSYMGLSTTISVVIKEWPTADPVLVRIEVKDLQTVFQIDEWNEYKFNASDYRSEASVECTYSDGHVETVPLENKYIYGVKWVDEPCDLKITIKYSDGGIEAQQTIIITITE